MKLNEIRDNPGAHKRSRPLGRGIGSGRGKTCGRGGKGQTARSGVRLKGFQGGQMPLSRRLPKRGFTNIHRLEYVTVNLDQLQQAVTLGKIHPSQGPIGWEQLKAAGLFKNPRSGVRVLGRGDLSCKIDLHIAGVTEKARKGIEAAGGSVTLIAR